MKKIVTTLMLCLICIGSYAEFPKGEFVQVVKGFMGAYQPKCAIATNPSTEDLYLALWTLSRAEYDKYDAESRVLLRFNDGTKFTLPRLEGDEVSQKTTSDVTSNGGSVTNYETITRYVLEKEVLNKLSQSVGIEKIRIVFAGGESRDYELKGGYQREFTAGLLKSMKKAQQDAKRISEQGVDSDF